ncbi:ABC transporter permease [Longispora albida]|uniref:ABC transporter permease n=1 Tax=Longispora albida TaxID=203523 RepID=UPI0003613CA5|nr:ABC transporter permease [Longispora albida]
MNPRITLSTAGRVLRQLRHDHRTVGLVLVVPAVLLTLIKYLFEAQPAVFQGVGLIMLGVFPFILMFLVTSVAMLRERTSGTLERLLTTPLGKLDLLLGYGLAFAVAAALQAAVSTLFAYFALGLDPRGSLALVIAIAVVNALLGMALGLFASTFARNEFQAVQFMPVFALPQLLLCGLFVSRDQMAGWLQAISDALPLTYAVEALQEVGTQAEPTGTLWRDVSIVGGAVVLALILGAATLRRRSG